MPMLSFAFSYVTCAYGLKRVGSMMASVGKGVGLAYFTRGSLTTAGTGMDKVSYLSHQSYHLK